MNYTKEEWEAPWRNNMTHCWQVNNSAGSIEVRTDNGYNDAKLVHSSPEMYELLQIVYACLRRPDTERDENRVINMINSLLARIEGK